MLRRRRRSRRPGSLPSRGALSRTPFFVAARIHRAGGDRLAFLLLGLTVGQILLGIATVVTGISLPIAVGHQLVGALLFGVAVAGAHRLGWR